MKNGNVSHIAVNTTGDLFPETIINIRRLNEAQAVERVRKHLARRVKLRVHRQVPAGVALYNFDPANEILVSNESTSGYRVGGTAFLSVNTISGEVSFHGHRGE